MVLSPLTGFSGRGGARLPGLTSGAMDLPFLTELEIPDDDNLPAVSLDLSFLPEMESPDDENCPAVVLELTSVMQSNTEDDKSPFRGERLIAPDVSPGSADSPLGKPRGGYRKVRLRRRQRARCR